MKIEQKCHFKLSSCTWVHPEAQCCVFPQVIVCGAHKVPRPVGILSSAKAASTAWHQVGWPCSAAWKCWYSTRWQDWVRCPWWRNTELNPARDKMKIPNLGAGVRELKTGSKWIVNHFSKTIILVISVKNKKEKQFTIKMYAVTPLICNHWIFNYLEHEMY